MPVAMVVLMETLVSGNQPVGWVASGHGTPGFRRIQLVLAPEAEVRFGEILYVTLRHGQGFVARVLEATEINPNAEPARVHAARAFQLEVPLRGSNSSPEVVRTAACELIEEVTHDGPSGTFQLSSPRSAPVTGAAAYRASPRLVGHTFGFRRESWGIHLGAEDTTGTDVFLPPEAVARHIAILGRPGTGKSYTTGVIMEELRDAGVPVVCLDLTGENVQATRELGGTVLDPGRHFTVRLSYLSSHEVPHLAPSLSPDQRDLVVDVFESVHQTHGYNWEPSLLYTAIAQAGRSLGGGQVQVAGRAVNRLRYHLQNRGFIGPGTDWPGLFLRHPIITVNARPLSHYNARLMAAALCRELLHLREQDAIPAFVLVLDEAHILIPSDDDAPSGDVIAFLLRVGRHLAIGVVLVTQSPSRIRREALMLANTRIVHALDGAEMGAISGLLGDAPRELESRIPIMQAGTAVLCGSQEIVRHTCLVGVRRRRTTHGAPTPDIRQLATRWLGGRGATAGPSPGAS
jgi:DNA helicase HerA-like ATPase